MKFLSQIAIMLFICLMGDVLSLLLPFAFPGNVLALIILFLCLFCRIVKTSQIKDLAVFLLENLSLLFIPVTVSIIKYLDILTSIIIPFLLICFITTIITFLCTAYSVNIITFLFKKREGKKDAWNNKKSVFWNYA